MSHITNSFTVTLNLMSILHSQLKMKLPGCPYVWDPHDLRQTFGAKTEDLTEDEFMGDIEELIANEINTHNDLIPESIGFIKTLIHNSSDVFKNKYYARISQTIPQHKKDVVINFHTAAYNDDNGALINKEYNTVISWLVIPIAGDVTQNTTGYTLSRDPEINVRNIGHRILVGNKRDTVLSNDVARALDPKTYKGCIDNEYEKTEASVRAQRTSARRFMVRDVEPEKVQKKDITVDTSILTAATNNLVTPAPRNQQILMTNNTRASGYLIRERLMSSYKANRIRNDPEAIKRQSRADLTLQHTGDHVAKTHNQSYRSLERDVDGEVFDYVYDCVGIKMFSALYKFNPTTSGKIRLNGSDTGNTFFFISVMRHESYLHITLHEITIG